jgi:multiple sugar transport system substrate-binding protein
VTHFRPAYPDYPHVSDAIQVAMEAVMTGQLTPQAATAAYADQVKAAVGPDQVTSVS